MTSTTVCFGHRLPVQPAVPRPSNMEPPIDIVDRLMQGWLAANYPENTKFVIVQEDQWLRCTQLTREAAKEIQILRERITDLQDELQRLSWHGEL